MTLTDKGIVCRIEHAGFSARYEERVGDNQHHPHLPKLRPDDVDYARGEAP